MTTETTPTRARIESYVESHPGIHFNGVVRGMELAPGQVQYHLRRLTRAGAVLEEQHAGRTHYYPPSFDAWERGVLALFRRETSRDILAMLLRDGPSSPTAIAERVGIARSTVAWHTDRLVGHEIVEKRRDSRGRVTVALAHPTETERLLERISPSRTDRAIDRFTRLVDGLLDD
ncbi:winged helix-turn-helix transcriptional regulator [Haloferacaceae archaeon DSL9]